MKKKMGENATKLGENATKHEKLTRGKNEKQYEK